MPEQHQTGDGAGHDVVPGRGEAGAEADQPGGGAQRGVQVGAADGAAQRGQRAARAGGQPRQRERAVRHALAVERGAQLAHALGQQGRAEAGQLGPRVPPRGGADREVADDDPAAADLGRSAAGQRDQRPAVAGAEEHAAQRQPGGVAGEHADDVAAAVVGHVR